MAPKPVLQVGRADAPSPPAREEEGQHFTWKGLAAEGLELLLALGTAAHPPGSTK